MAKKQDSINRIKIFLRRNIDSLIKRLSIESIKGRLGGPIVIINSLPKAGTNLADNVLFNIPSMRRKFGRTLKHPNKNILARTKLLKSIINYSDEKNTKKTISYLKKMKKGQYSLCHIDFKNEFEEIVDKKNIKVIYVIRDPRDKIISHYKYVSEIDSTHREHKFFKTLDSDDEKINTLINGVDGFTRSIDEQLNSYNGWSKSKNCLTVKFENLIGENGGGSNDLQLQSLNKIIEFLNIDLNESQKNKILKNLFSKKSPTFRKGTINNWKKIMSKKHKKTLKIRIGQWLIDNGYENDFNW